MVKLNGGHEHKKDKLGKHHHEEEDDKFEIKFKGDVKDLPNINIGKQPKPKKKSKGKSNKSKEELKNKANEIESKFNAFETTKQMLQQASGTKIPIFIEDLNQPVGSMPTKRELNDIEGKINTATNNLRQFSMRTFNIDISDLQAQNRQNAPQPPQPPQGEDFTDAFQQPPDLQAQQQDAGFIPALPDPADPADPSELFQARIPERQRINEPIPLPFPSQPNNDYYDTQQIPEYIDYTQQIPLQQPEEDEDQPLLMPQQLRLESQQYIDQQAQPEAQLPQLELGSQQYIDQQPAEENSNFQDFYDIPLEVPELTKRTDATFDEAMDLEPVSPTAQKRIENKMKNIEDENERLKEELKLLKEMEHTIREEEQNLLGIKYKPVDPDEDEELNKLFKEIEELERMEKGFGLTSLPVITNSNDKDLNDKADEIIKLQDKIEDKIEDKKEENVKNIDDEIERLEEEEKTDAELLKEFDELKAEEKEAEEKEAKEKEQEILDEMNTINPQLEMYNNQLDDIVDEFDVIKQTLITTSRIKNPVNRNRFLDKIINQVKTLALDGGNTMKNMNTIKNSITKDTYKEFENEIEDELYNFYKFNVRDLTNRVQVAWTRIENIRNNRDLEDGVDEIKDKIRPQDKGSYEKSTTAEKATLRLKNPAPTPETLINQLNSFITN